MKMEEGSHNCSHGSTDEPSRGQTRNISTAPAFTMAGLEAVMEEDESQARTPRPEDVSDEGEADDEMVENEENEGPKSPKGLNKSRQASANLRSGSPKRPGTSSSRRQNSAGKTVSRTSSRKSRTSRVETSAAKNAGQSSDSESDIDDIIRNRDNRSDLDLLMPDLGNEKDWDTDLETEEPPSAYDHTGKSAYVEACKKFGVVPASYFLRHMNDTNLSMKHHGLAGDGMKAIAASLVSNATINNLDLSDNWLGTDGGLAVSEMLRENCFITDLNLSDNHLNPCCEQLCRIIEQNDTLRRVTLSGNGFDDITAEHVANLILNTTKLEYLNLSHNNFGEKSGMLLGPAISENLCLKELDLSWNHLRRRGAMAVGAGIKNNVYMKKINLAWNGLGLEGSIALMDALKANNVLEEIDITNNRVTTEGAVLIGKGLTVNETLKVLKIGKNPMQSAGCWGLAAAVLKNPNCVLETIDCTDVLVNKDFVEIWKQVEEQFPNLKMLHGGTEPPLKPKKPVHPMIKLAAFISNQNLQLVDFFSKFDKDGSMFISTDDFRQGLQILLKETGISLSAEEIELLVSDLDANKDGAVNYSELVLGQQEYLEKEKRMSMTVRPMTS